MTIIAVYFTPETCEDETPSEEEWAQGYEPFSMLIAANCACHWKFPIIRQREENLKKFRVHKEIT